MDLAFFWVAGFSQRYLCDTKVPSITRLVSDNALACNFTVNDHEYNMEYYLADDIYPKWVTLMKTIQNPETRAVAEFAKTQETARKDIARAFSVL
jgi:hypothetical protein